jgi:hypothetical protein
MLQWASSVAALIERFGKDHVLGRIARGGMAEIYKVKTVGIAGFEKVQALKRIRPHFAREPRFIRSFIDEARIAAELNHRNIVQVFDFGKAEGELFLAMELIDGVNLRTAMVDAQQQSHDLPVPVACYILGEIAAGLDYAGRVSGGAARTGRGPLPASGGASCASSSRWRRANAPSGASSPQILTRERYNSNRPVSTGQAGGAGTRPGLPSVAADAYPG